MAGRDETSFISQPSGQESGGSTAVRRGIFTREGEFWRIGLEGGDSFALRHTKGLAYLAQLLRFSGREFHALDLISGTASDFEEMSASRRAALPRGDRALASAGIHVGDLGDAGEMLDQRAKAQYRGRIAELRQDLEDAKRLGQIDRAEQAEAEIEALAIELSRAVGLGGRNRKSASASERARQSVTHAIRSALGKIEENHRELGRILARRVATGTFCSYQPDPAAPIVWEFGAVTDASGGDGRPREHRGAGLAAIDAFRPPIVAARARNRAEMVGRDAELARLGKAADRALEGHGSVVLIAGGPGVGKTRLSMEFLAHASRRGFTCLNGRCYERDEPHPLMPFVEIIEGSLARASSVEQLRTLAADKASDLAQIAPALRRVFPDLPAPADLPTPQLRRHLFQSLFDFIARMSRMQPLLLVLDDIHWADESTLAMVNFLARRADHVPLLVLANYRDELLDATRPLNRTLEELVRLGIVPIKLKGLSREGVARMLAGLSGRNPPDHLVTLIFEETQGNPFFVEEVFSHLVEEGSVYDEAGEFRAEAGGGDLTVPDNVRLVLGRRLERVSEEAREVLSAASVIGRSFTFMLLEAVLDRWDPDALFEGIEEAERAGFITSSSQGPEAPFAFSHELVRQTLLGGISQPRQQRLHLKIAQAMEKVFGTRIEEHAAEVAYHLVKSGAYVDAAMAMRYLSLTGQSLLRTGALEDARLALAKALQYGGADPLTRARTLANLASAERGMGDWSEAIAHLQQSLSLYAGAGDLRSVGRIVFEMVEGFIWTGHFDEAADITEKGLAHLRVDESAYRARLLAARGLIHALRGEYSAAISAFDEAVKSPGVTPFLARVLAYRSVCYFYFLRLERALEDSVRSAALSNPQDSPWTHAAALSRTMLSLHHLGKPDQALKIAVDLEPLARSVGQLAALSFCVSTRAWAEFGREPDLALLDRRIGENVATNRNARVPLFLSESLAQMSLVRFLSGDWNSARAAAREASSFEPRGVLAGVSAAMQLRLAAYMNDRERALEIADETRGRLPIPGQVNTIGSFSLLMSTVESLAMIGERERTAALLPLVREFLESGAICLLYAGRFSETVAGIAAGAARNWDLAEHHFRSAQKLAAELPHQLEAAELRRFHAMMLLERGARGDRERARELLGEALATYTRIRMPRHVELTRSLLRQSS